MGKAAKSRATFRQIAVLPWRRQGDGALAVLLVTSRERRRWILPKGWPIKGMTDAEAAETEAMEEAGLVGRVDRKPLGRFMYEKRFPKKTEPVRVDVFGLEVERQLDDWPEKGQRETAWFTGEEAARLADDAGVGDLILAFLAAAQQKAEPG